MRTEALTGAMWAPLHAAECFDWRALTLLADETQIPCRRTYACGLVREYYPRAQ